MEKRETSRKSLLSVIAAIVVLAALLTLTFTGCFGGQSDPTTEPTTDQTEPSGSEGNTEEAAKLYWNVDRKESAGKRQPGADGAYEIVFAQGGKKVTLKVADQKLVETIDSMDMVALEVDDKGNVTKVIDLKELGYQEYATNFYVESIKDGVIGLRKNQDLTGDESMFKLEAATQVLDITGVSGEVGAKTTIEVGDGVTVILDANGDAVYVYVVDRQPPAVTVKALCEHCKKEADWIVWTKNASLPNTAGHYILDNDVNPTASAELEEGARICLDLNGKTVTGAANTRVFNVLKGCHLTLMDSSKEKTGKIISSGNTPNGSIVAINAGMLNIYAGTYDASKATSTSNGTAFVVNANGVMNLYNGKVIGGTSKQNASKQFGCAGSIQIESNATFNMYDGEVTGGTAHNTGGQFRVLGVMNVYGGRITFGTSLLTAGGNISISRLGKVNLYGGYILDGTTTSNSTTGSNGGNIFSEGVLIINGGFIAGGTILDKNNMPIWDQPSRNLYHRNQSFQMYGGEILGYAQVADTSATDTYNTSVYVGGLANISGAAEGHKNLNMGTRVTFTVGKLLKGAKVVFNANMGQKLVVRGNKSDAEWAEYKAMVDNNCLVSENKSYSIAATNDAIVVVDGNAIMRCVCGDPTGTGTACADAGHQKVPFSAWSDATSLPSSGNYYLTTNVALSAQVTVNGGTAQIPGELSIDLNGKTVSVKGGIRAFAVANKYSVFNLVDTVGTGKIDYTSTNNSPGFGFGIQLNAADATVNMYGGTITGTRYAGTGGSGVILGSACNATSSVFNMYGGTITGGEAAKGGNVFLHVGIFNMYGGVVSNGVARDSANTAYTDGGNFYLNNLSGSATKVTSTVNIYGGEIRGGAAANGSSIYANKGGLVNMYGGKVTGCNATGNSGVVQISADSSMVMTGGQITANSSANGALLVKAGGKLTVSGAARVTGNAGANIYLEDGTAIAIGEAGLTTGDEGAKFGVAMKTPGVFTSNAVAEGAEACFRSDSDGYKAVKNSQGMMALVVGEEEGDDSVVKYCLCGDPTSTGNPCAEEGHKEYIWTAWEKADSLPDSFGYWYLTKNVTLTEVCKIKNVDAIYLNLNGKTVTQSAADAAVIELENSNLAITATTGSGKIDGKVVAGANSALALLRAEIKEIQAPTGTVTLFSGKVGTASDCGDLFVSGSIKIDNLIIDSNTGLFVDENNLVYGISGAKIGVTVENKDQYFAYGPFGGAVVNAFFSVDENYSVSNETEGLRLRPAGEMWHCLCGNPSNDNEFNPCAKEGHKLIQWNKWDKTDSLPEAAAGTQRIYLAGDVTLKQLYELAADQVLIIDLNGKTISMASSGNYRPHLFEMTATADMAAGTPDIRKNPNAHSSNDNTKLILTDSIGTGTLDYSNCTSYHAPGIFLEKGNIDMYGGTITTDGAWKSSSGGGALVFRQGSTSVFNMYGGKFTGGNNGTTGANGGGNIQLRQGVFNLYDGIIENGTSQNGGNIFFRNHASATADPVFNMYGGIIRGGTTGGSSATGGNIYIQRGSFNMYGGTIEGGKATRGGSVYLATGAKFNMSGDAQLIGDGSVNAYSGSAIFVQNAASLTMTDNAKISGFASSGNSAVLLFSDNTAQAPKLTMSGNATITGNVGKAAGYGGGLDVGSANCIVTVSGSAKIAGNTDKDGKPADVYFRVEAPFTIGAEGLNDDASFGILMATPGCVCDKPAPTGVFFSNNAAYKATAEETGVYLRDINLPYNCICGAGAGEDHASICDGVDFLWDKLEATSDLANGGTFYLDAATTVADVTVGEGKELSIDLRGKVLTANITVASKDAYVSISDSVGGGKLAGKVTVNHDEAGLVIFDAAIEAVDNTKGAVIQTGGKVTAAAIGGAYGVGGAAKVDGATVTGDGAIVVFEDLAEAKIVLNGPNGDKPLVLDAYAEEVEFFVSGDAQYKVNREGDGLHLRPVAEVWHCLCADVDNEDGHNPCANDGHKAIKWAKWDKTDSLPTSGIYYLASDVTLNDVAVYDAAGSVALDLNGKTIKSTGNNDTAHRLFEVKHDDFTLTITDGVGTGKLDYSNTNANSAQEHGKGIILRNGTINLYGGTITGEGRQKLVYTGGAGLLMTNANSSPVFNMYGGAFVGGKVNPAGGGGGNILLRTGTFNMYGGTISKGDAGATGKGGNISTQIRANMTPPVFNMYGGVIKEGTAKMGGSIYIGVGEFNIMGGEIYGTDVSGTTNKFNGGAIYLNRDVYSNITAAKNVLNLKGGVIYAGTTGEVTLDKTLNSYASGCWGGAIQVEANSTFNMTGGIIDASGCYAEYGVAVLNQGTNAVFNLSGGDIYGGTATGSGGGAIVNISGATVNMSGGNIMGGHSTTFNSAANQGGANVNNASKFYMTGGTITGGWSESNRGGGINVRTGSDFVISGNAKIYGNAGGDIHVCDGAKITIGAAGLGEEAELGILMKTPGTFTTNAVDAAQVARFFSYSDKYEIAANADGTLKLVEKAG